MSAKHEPTISELFDFLQENMVTKEDLKQELKNFATKDDLNSALAKTKAEILDKMDEKLTDLKGDIITVVRKEDHKLVDLISLLRDKSVITKDEAKNLLGKEPFPQLFV